MAQVPRGPAFVLEAVLQLQLRVRGEAITHSGVDLPDIVSPWGFAAITVRNGAKELLIPAECAKELWSNFIFSLEIISKGIGIPDARHFKANLVKFRP